MRRPTQPNDALLYSHDESYERADSAPLSSCSEVCLKCFGVPASSSCLSACTQRAAEATKRPLETNWATRRYERVRLLAFEGCSKTSYLMMPPEAHVRDTVALVRGLATGASEK